MNIKERLNIYKKVSDDGIKLKNDNFINEIFSSDELSDNIISEVINSHSNLFFVSSVNCDNSIISAYLRNHISDQSSVCVVNNIDNDMNFLKYSNIFVQGADIKGFVKVLEHILSGYNGFIIGVNLKSYNNVIEDIQTLIAINYPNLSSEQIKNLLRAANPVFIYFDKDEDGLFFVKSIDNLIFSANVPVLKNIFSFCDSEELPKEEDKVESVKKPSSDTSVKDVDSFNTETVKKINKYKLLKEKRKNKKR